MDVKTPRPGWVSAFAWVMLVWNLLGVFAWVMHLSLTPQALAQLPPAQQALYQDIPVWLTLAFGVAVLAGTLGALLLLAGKALALPVYALSLLGIGVQQFYNFVVIDSLAVLGHGALVMPSLVVLLALVQLRISWQGQQLGWLQ